MSEVIARVFIAGRPRTKGHMLAGPGGRGMRDRELLQVWMRTLARGLQSQLGIKLKRVARKVRRSDAEPYAGAVEIHCFFRFEREVSVDIRRPGQVLPSCAGPWPTTILFGDEDTLRRAVLDALVKSGVIADDSLSVGGMNYKRWCEPGEQAGVLIVVQEPPSVQAVLLTERAAMAGEL